MVTVGAVVGVGVGVGVRVAVVRDADGTAEGDALAGAEALAEALTVADGETRAEDEAPASARTADGTEVPGPAASWAGDGSAVGLSASGRTTAVPVPAPASTALRSGRFFLTPRSASASRRASHRAGGRWVR